MSCQPPRHRESAGVLLATASSGTCAASAKFETSGTNLIVTLTNTSALDALVPTDVLTGVFFDIGGSALLLGRTGAVVPAGSSVFNGPVDPGNVVGGEWAYLGGLSGAPHGAKYGISSAGLGLFGPSDLFPGNDLQPPTSPDGVQYGITTAGDNLATGNAPMMSNALIKNEVVLTLSGVPANFDPMASIGNVSFQYGTALDEPNIPAPSGVALLGISGLALLRGVARKRGCGDASVSAAQIERASNAGAAEAAPVFTWGLTQGLVASRASVGSGTRTPGAEQLGEV